MRELHRQRNADIPKTDDGDVFDCVAHRPMSALYHAITFSSPSRNDTAGS